MRGERHRRRLAAAVHFTRSKVSDERISVFIGHPDIADQDVRSVAIERAEGCTHRGHGFDVRAGELEDESESLSPIGVVLREQHADAVEPG